MDTAVNGPLLLNELLLDYDSFSRPASGDQPCRVQVSLAPSFLTWKDDQLKMAFTLEHTWLDERLRFTVISVWYFLGAGSHRFPDTDFLRDFGPYCLVSQDPTGPSGT